MPITVEKIQVFLGPTEQDAPDSLLTPIIGFIDKARKKQKLMVAVQEIENKQIVEALVRARKRGVTIDIVIEQSYLLSDKIPDNPFEPGGVNERNRFLYNAILRSCIDIKSDFNTNIFHQKFMILGNSVLTGSTNFTDTGVSKNLNHVVIVYVLLSYIKNGIQCTYDLFKTFRQFLLNIFIMMEMYYVFNVFNVFKVL